MKLRNKKTGEVEDLSIFGIELNIRKENQPIYHSLAELNEEWEDYEPDEPIFVDKKICKAVRAWAEANGIERVWHEYSSSWLRGNGLKIELENEVVELPQGNYSIDELCGEEEE